MLVAAGVWIGLLALAGVAYRYFVVPHQQAEEEERRDEAISKTGSSSRFQSSVRIAHDAFSGYSVLRSPALAERMTNRGIRLDFQDDGADYEARIRALQSGSVQMAVFTIDALLIASAGLGEFPATILLVIDETRGADALVAHSAGVPDLDALNSPLARVVYTPSSPSETLARVVHDQFNIDAPVMSWLDPAADIDTVFRRLTQAVPTAPRAYVLWEPYLSRALEIPGVNVLVDTSQVRGAIVDVLVASRAWLAEEGGVARAVVEEYLATAYEVERSKGWTKLVQTDAKSNGDALTDAQAQHLVDGIVWKNTLENYAHFGILEGTAARGVQHLEGMIRRLASLLVRSGALQSHPLEGRESWLYYDGILRQLQADSFHPALGKAAGQLGQDAPIRADATLPSLTDAEWLNLLPVGSLRVPPIRFGRGAARLNRSAGRALDQLAERIEAWPSYYLTIVGQSRVGGDEAANRTLAEQRAAAVVQQLVQLGVPKARMRAIARIGVGSGGAAQSVKFEVGQAPY